MSSHSSVKSSPSYVSSTGNTATLSHGTRSSSNHRRRNTSLTEPRIAPTRMTAFERLSLIRNALTRLQDVLERALHMATLDQAGGEVVEEFWEQLGHAVPRWFYNHETVSRSGAGGPSQQRAIYEGVLSIQKLAERALDATSPRKSSEAEHVYKGLKHGLVSNALDNLRELEELLSHKPGEMFTRIHTGLLQDQVAIHINDYDAFTNVHLLAMIQEMLNEGVFYSAPVMSESSQRASPAGVFSVMLLDVAVGVRPTKSARMVLEHAKMSIQKVENRIVIAHKALEGLYPSSGSDLRAAANTESQFQAYTVMLDRIRSSLNELSQMQGRWETEEDDIFGAAASGDYDLNVLLQTKSLKEMEIVEEARRIYDTTLHACLPFASPQYHRRYAETYGQPCHLRIALHFAAPSGPSRRVFTMTPQFASLIASRSLPEEAHQRYAYLAPSRDELWMAWGEFPEMVKGTRCVLRGVHARLDHFRALEEQKEIGGYFVVNGNERILRLLLMQRSNIAINIERDRFEQQGPNFLSKAVLIRSKRPSGITVQNYFYYTSVGEIVFSFARKVIWHIPLPLLLLATSTQCISTVELYRFLTIGMPEDHHLARVEVLIQQHLKKPYSGLTNYLDFITVLGRMYRGYHQNSNAFHFLPQFVRGGERLPQHDAWYGVFLLRRHLLPHLNGDVPTPDLAPEADAAALRRWLPRGLLDELDRKFDALIAITRQLYCFVGGQSAHQGNDSPAYQELFSISQVLMGAFEVCLNRFFRVFALHFGRHLPESLLHTVLGGTKTGRAGEVMRQLREYTGYAARHSATDPLEPLHRFFITGNLNLDREEDFYYPQTSGWVVMAEHLNFYRFFEQLRCVHRGRTIAGMRSSEVRKYPCESFGFICMVHSPDGEDCGVLNHLSISTIAAEAFDVSPDSAPRRQIEAWVGEVLPNLRSRRGQVSLLDRLLATVPVWVEGELRGYATAAEALHAAEELRLRKTITRRALIDANGLTRRRDVSVLHTLEVVYVAPGEKDPAGLYLFYGGGRLMRPVQRIETESSGSAVAPSEKALAFPLVYVGTWEQTWLDIASVPSDLLDAVTQLNRKFIYMEQSGSNILSLTSATIPFFEYNCSPRNLFQCGLSKQSAGTQLQAMSWRKEAKLFRMYTPQRYLSRTLPMDYFDLDDVNLGVNAVVAILAYTGFDMDDAVILNSTASQRGMLNAGVTIAKIVHASGRGEKDDLFVFHNLVDVERGECFSAELQPNGLPLPRAIPDAAGFDLADHAHPSLGDPTPVYCCAKRVARANPLTNRVEYVYTHHQTTKWQHFDRGERGWVDRVVPLAYDGPDPVSAMLIFRIPRPPAVGDKFASRHGQKGTLPLQIRAHDLPFTTRGGLTPDVIINPHAFPSRMTVGMVLEMLTGKLAALEGRFVDNSAWALAGERPRAAEAIGEALARAGFSRHGRESLVDGVSGEAMEADVFVGVAGYQRLRHMVNDKWQARARTDAHTHRAVTKTGQPVKGRKRHGGVRVGEMERDGLLSHGASEVVVDRLMHVSDKTRAFICVHCGGLLSIYERYASEYATWKTCRFCGAGTDEGTDKIAMVEIPQVLRLWASELTSIGIRVVLKTS
ncbi:unnamed protein product [Phytomonas sp. Hart1]|nr:unnamed protein product [Phytomonas sp. Hart1]|eukprot:CCW70880.1 unnamed protein product [Phytomonas sp. isolate Hart1]